MFLICSCLQFHCELFLINCLSMDSSSSLGFWHIGSSKVGAFHNLQLNRFRKNVFCQFLPIVIRCLVRRFNLSSLAFWDYENETWPCTRDKWVHYDGFVDGRTSRTSLVVAVVCSQKMNLEIKYWLMLI